MTRLTQEMKELIAAQQCFVATVNPDGTPNIGPKRSTRVLDDEHLAFNEATGKRTWSNVQNGSTVAIAVVDREKMKGFRFVGIPEVITSGDLYEQAVAAAAKRPGLPPPKAVVKIKIAQIYNLGFPGAGDELA